MAARAKQSPTDETAGRKPKRARSRTAAAKSDTAKSPAAKKAAKTPSTSKPASAAGKSGKSVKTRSKSTTAGKSATQKARVTSQRSSDQQTGQSLEAEISRLEAALAAARKRISEVEALNEQAVNRIDWVIDSLQTLMADQEKK